MAFPFRKKKFKVDIQDGGHGGQLGFSPGIFLASFDLQVAVILPTEVRIKWPFGLGEEAEI